MRRTIRPTNRMTLASAIPSAWTNAVGELSLDAAGELVIAPAEQAGLSITLILHEQNQGKKINWRDGLKALWYLLRYRFGG